MWTSIRNQYSDLKNNSTKNYALTEKKIEIICQSFRDVTKIVGKTMVRRDKWGVYFLINLVLWENYKILLQWIQKKFQIRFYKNLQNKFDIFLILF